MHKMGTASVAAWTNENMGPILGASNPNPILTTNNTKIEFHITLQCSQSFPVIVLIIPS